MRSFLKVQLNTRISNAGIRQLGSTLNKEAETRLVETFFQQIFAAAEKAMTDSFQLSIDQISTEKGKAQE